MLLHASVVSAGCCVCFWGRTERTITRNDSRLVQHIYIQLGTAPRRQNPFKLKFNFLECDLQLVMLVIVIVMKYHKFNYI